MPKKRALANAGKSTHNRAASAPERAQSRKRAADEPSESSRKTAKAHHKSTPGSAKGQIVKWMPTRPRTDETKRQKDTYLQVGRYLLEQFSIPAFRPHATIGLIDRDCIQFYHANHSVVLVSSAINLLSSDRTDGLDKFIAIVIAFSRLSLRDNGILHDLHNGKMFRDNEKLPKSGLAPGSMRIQEGNKLEFGGDEKTKPFTLTWRDHLSRAIAGRTSNGGTACEVFHVEEP